VVGGGLPRGKFVRLTWVGPTTHKRETGNSVLGWAESGYLRREENQEKKPPAVLPWGKKKKNKKAQLSARKGKNVKKTRRQQHILLRV